MEGGGLAISLFYKKEVEAERNGRPCPRSRSPNSCKAEDKMSMSVF